MRLCATSVESAMVDKQGGQRWTVRVVLGTYSKNNNFPKIGHVGSLVAVLKGGYLQTNIHPI